MMFASTMSLRYLVVPMISPLLCIVQELSLTTPPAHPLSNVVISVDFSIDITAFFIFSEHFSAKLYALTQQASTKASHIYGQDSADRPLQIGRCFPILTHGGSPVL